MLPPSSPASSLVFFNSLSITRQPANQGVYPITFTLFRTGSYLVHITSHGQDVQGSPTTIVVSNDILDSDASYAVGTGLQGGVAGQPLVIDVTAKDTHQPAVQYIVSSATVSEFTQEVQQIQLGSGVSSFVFSYRGVTSATTLSPGATLASISTALTALNTLGTFTVEGTNGATTLSAGGDPILVTFTSLLGPLPLLQGTVLTGSGMVSVTKYTAGDAPYRQAVQVIKCSALGAHPNSVVFSASSSPDSPFTNPLLLDTTLAALAQEIRYVSTQSKSGF